MQTGRDLYSQWLFDLKDAAQELRQRVKKVKSCRMQCGDVLGAALAVVMALEQAMLMDRLDERSKEVPEVFAEAVSTIELAQALVQVCESRWQLSGCPCFSSYQEHHSLAGLGQVWWTLRDDSTSTALSAVSIRYMAGAEEPECMWLGNDDGCVSQARLPKTSTGSQPIVTLVISLDQSIGQNTRTSGQASLAQRSSMSHELASTNPHASSSARKHLPQPRFSNPSQYTASEIRQQQSGGTTPIAGLGHTSAINHSPSYDDQPEHTVEYSLDIMSTQLSPHSTAFARAGGQQHMPLHPGPRSMQNQAGSAKQPCQLAHDGPVLEIMVISNRVVTRGGREHTLIMKEWTPKGELVGTHAACKQGPITCMTALHQPASLYKHGHLALHAAPHPTMCPPWAESHNAQDLPVLLLQHAVCQAHQLGLEQCMKCEVGLVSVGECGTILMWAEDQLSSMLEQPCFLADGGDSEREPHPTSLDDHHACYGAASLLQRFLDSVSVLAMNRALGGSNKDKSEEPHSLTEALGGADTQQTSSTAHMSIGARLRALALGRSSGARSKGSKEDHLHRTLQMLASIFTSHSAPQKIPQVASEQIPHVAAGSPATPTNSLVFSAPAAISVTVGRRPSLPLGNDALQAGSCDSQQSCVRPLKRTISDVALEALQSVDSLKCPIIEYSHLDIKGKIGAGSIGQVYLAKWQETDVAVKVITQMQQLSPLRAIPGQAQSSMQPCHVLGKHANTQTASQAKALGKQHTGIDMQELDTQGIAGTSMAFSHEEEVNTLDTAQRSPMSDKELTAITILEREVSIMAAIRHPNVVMFMGLCLNPVCVVTEFCVRGSLSDVLEKAASDAAFAQQLPWPKRLSMSLDAAKGMLQLHSHKPPILHRDLKSPNLLVDKHWRVKVTDFNLSSMLRLDADSDGVDSSAANNPRWLAPEVISVQNFSKAADVYSFGIILWELMTWQVPWDDLNPFQIMMLLTQQHARPDILPVGSLPGGTWPGMREYILLMQACWEEEPDKRPDFESIIADLRGMLRCTAATRQRSQALTDLPSQMSSSTWPDSPRQLAEQSLTPLEVSPLPVSGRAAANPKQQANIRFPQPAFRPPCPGIRPRAAGVRPSWGGVKP
ncbi:hypothetical protein WJX79_007764 [Trebouxia sp. C0005]